MLLTGVRWCVIMTQILGRKLGIANSVVVVYDLSAVRYGENVMNY